MFQTLTVFDAKKDRNVSVGIMTDTDFIKNVEREKHFLRAYNGYAIDRRAIDKLVENNIKRIVIRESNEIEYTIRLHRFLELSKEVDFGHGAQLVTDEKYYIKHDKNQPRFL